MWRRHGSQEGFASQLRLALRSSATYPWERPWLGQATGQAVEETLADKRPLLEWHDLDTTPRLGITDVWQCTPRHASFGLKVETMLFLCLPFSCPTFPIGWKFKKEQIGCMNLFGKPMICSCFLYSPGSTDASAQVAYRRTRPRDASCGTEGRNVSFGRFSVFVGWDTLMF